MTRVASVLFILTAVSAALFLFHIKQQVRELEEELGIVQRDILLHPEAIQVLRTEWSYLNRPARIAELAERHLQMKLLAARQYVGFEEIPYRTAGAAGGTGGCASSWNPLNISFGLRPPSVAGVMAKLISPTPSVPATSSATMSWKTT